MKTFKVIFSNFVLLFLVVIIFYLSIALIKKNREIIRINSSISLYEYRLNKNVTKFSREVFTEYQTMDNIFLTDLQGDSIQLSQLLQTPKFVYRFSYQSCLTCVEEDIKQLRQFGDSIGYQNILIISDYENIRELATFKKKFEIKSPIYIYRKCLNLSVESELKSEKATFYFVIDNTLKVRFVFLSEAFTEFENIYFERIKKFFLTN